MVHSIHILHIAGIHGKRKAKKGYQYEVSWEGYPGTRTWEPQENIPRFLTTYYDKTGRESIPRAKIRHTKMVGSTKYLLLVWEDDENTLPSYVPEQDFFIPDEDYKELKTTCNTQNMPQRMSWSFSQMEA